jgi:AraC family transcriptional regulator, regulatory protein of adaptative response / DNA-3-methyladenine glycosylase II
MSKLFPRSPSPALSPAFQFLALQRWRVRPSPLSRARAPIAALARIPAIPAAHSNSSSTKPCHRSLFSEGSSTRTRPGLRVPGVWDGFELAVRAVLGQQITVPTAIRLAAKLVAHFGEPLRNFDPALTHVFPVPSALAGANLSTLGMPQRRAVTLSSVAAAVLADPHIFAAGRNLHEAVTQLRTLPGIGEWTAQYIAMRQLREPDAFPAADIGLVRAMADSEGLRQSASELLARAERWRPWRAYAAQHLWASV